MKLCKCKKCSKKPKHFPSNKMRLRLGLRGRCRQLRELLVVIWNSTGLFSPGPHYNLHGYKSIFTQPTPQKYKTEEVSFHSAAPTMRDAKIDFHSAWNHHFNHLHWIENWNFPLSASRCLEAENAMLLRRTCLMVDWENASKAVEKVVVPTIKIRSPWELSGSSQQRGGS